MASAHMPELKLRVPDLRQLIQRVLQAFASLCTDPNPYLPY